MEAELEEELAAVGDETTLDGFGCEEVPIRFKETDGTVDRVVLVWVPWVVDGDGATVAAF